MVVCGCVWGGGGGGGGGRQQCQAARCLTCRVSPGSAPFTKIGSQIGLPLVTPTSALYSSSSPSTGTRSPPELCDRAGAATAPSSGTPSRATQPPRAFRLLVKCRHPPCQHILKNLRKREGEEVGWLVSKVEDPMKTFTKGVNVAGEVLGDQDLREEVRESAERNGSRLTVNVF